jgi:hypothetical protein
MNVTEKRAYRLQEAAAYLGRSVRRIQELVANGDLPVRYEGATPLYDVKDLDRFFEALPAERRPSKEKSRE